MENVKTNMKKTDLGEMVGGGTWARTEDIVGGEVSELLVNSS